MMVRTTRHGMFNTPKTIAAAPPSGIDSRLVTKMSRFWHVTKNNRDIFVTSECSRDIFVTFVLDCHENVPNLVNSESTYTKSRSAKERKNRTLFLSQPLSIGPARTRHSHPVNV